MNKKYPGSLFWIGFITNIVGRFFFFTFLSIVLLMIGIWNRVCLYSGFALLILVVAISLIQQLIVRHTSLTSDNPNFKEIQKAILSSDWKDNIINIVEDQSEKKE